MPLYTVRCLNQHSRDVYYHRSQDKGCHTHICPQCGEGQGFVLSMGSGLTYFSESHAQIITNLGHEPIAITSPDHLEREMKKRGPALAGRQRGMPGVWT